MSTQDALCTDHPSAARCTELHTPACVSVILLGVVLALTGGSLFGAYPSTGPLWLRAVSNPWFSVPMAVASVAIIYALIRQMRHEYLSTKGATHDEN